MFKLGKSSSQGKIFFDPESEYFLNRVKGTEQDYFRKLIFENIDQNIFKVLFAESGGRPNAPINCLVSALILREKNNWSYRELLDELNFNIANRYAVGIDNFEKVPFNKATIFNFLNRLSSYQSKTEINLFEKVFTALTKNQLTKLKVKTNIARTDSTMICSNIRKTTRLQLILEVFLRLHRILEEGDKAKIKVKFPDYIKTSSDRFVFNLKRAEITHELDKIGNLYLWIVKNLHEKYHHTLEYKTFFRVFKEQFFIENNQPNLKDPKDVGSGSVQSPDDLDATFRNKNGKSYQGFVVSAVETANPKNKFNLITDVVVTKNNINDADILHSRLDKVLGIHKDLILFSQDNGYSKPSNDEIFEKNRVKVVQKVPPKKLSFINIKNENGDYKAECKGGQIVPLVKGKSKFRGEFDKKICKNCQCKSDCPTFFGKLKTAYYFKNKPSRSFLKGVFYNTLPDKIKNLRNNVEATMNELTCRTKAHKLKVRGLFSASNFAFLTTMGINFGKIYRSIGKNESQIFNYFKKFLFYRFEFQFSL